MFRGRSHGCHGCCSHDYYLKRVCVCACVCACACVDYDVWGEEDEKTIKFSLLFQIICGSERTFSRSERRAEKKRKKRRLALGPLFFAKEKREERVLEDRKTASSDKRGSFSLHNYPAFYLFYYIYILLLNGPIDDDDDDDDDDDVFIIFVFVFVFVSLDEEVVREEYHRRRRFEEEVQQQQKRAARRGGGEWGGR